LVASSFSNSAGYSVLLSILIIIYLSSTIKLYSAVSSSTDTDGTGGGKFFSLRSFSCSGVSTMISFLIYGLPVC